MGMPTDQTIIMQIWDLVLILAESQRDAFLLHDSLRDSIYQIKGFLKWFN